MNYKVLASNAVTAFAAQGISLLVSVLMSLLVPKVLGVSTYGYWQLFIFYTSYSGLFEFGLNDGVYLLEGGKTRSEIDKKSINSQFWFNVCLQTIIGVIITLVAMFSSNEPEREFVLLSFALYTVMLDVSAFLGYVFQAMNETKLFSRMALLERLAFLVPMIVLVILKVDQFQGFVIAYLAAKSLALFYSLMKGRDILVAGQYSIKRTIGLSLKSISVGFGLMIANIADMLILGVGRFLADGFWGIEVFGKISFSLSLVNFFVSFVSQAAMVLFPALRQGSFEERRNFYHIVRDTMEFVFPLIYALYFPLVCVLSIWLPQYSDSYIYFAYLLPVCVFNTKMTVCCSTYFKVLRMERTLLKANLVTLLLSLGCALLGVFAFNSLEVVLLGAVASIICRSIWSERKLDSWLDVKKTLVPFEEIFLTLSFIVIAVQIRDFVGFITYLIIYLIYLLLNRDSVNKLYLLFRKFAVSTTVKN